MPKTEWLALSYTVPTTPSKVRVYVWRRLRSIGAQQIRNGLAILPNTAECFENFQQLAQKIRELSGEATLIEMNFAEESEHREMKQRFSDANEAQLRSSLKECEDLLDKINNAADPHSRSLMQRELQRKIKRLGADSSPFKAQAAELERATADIISALKALPAEFSAMIKAAK